MAYRTRLIDKKPNNVNRPHIMLSTGHHTHLKPSVLLDFALVGLRLIRLALVLFHLADALDMLCVGGAVEVGVAVVARDAARATVLKMQRH
jgi:hypothetical protein